MPPFTGDGIGEAEPKEAESNKSRKPETPKLKAFWFKRPGSLG